MPNINENNENNTNLSTGGQYGNVNIIINGIINNGIKNFIENLYTFGLSRRNFATINVIASCIARILYTYAIKVLRFIKSFPKLRVRHS
jgi:hypothetical protein